MITLQHYNVCLIEFQPSSVVNSHRRFGCLQSQDQIITVLRNVGNYFLVLRGVNERWAAATLVVLLSGHNSPIVHKIPNVQPAQQQPQCRSCGCTGVECCAGQVAMSRLYWGGMLCRTGCNASAVLGWNVVPDRLQVLRLLQILPFLMSVNAITLTLVSSNRKPCWQQRTPCFVTQCAVCTLCFASPVTLYQLDFLKTASRITLPAACHLHTAAHLPSRSTQCWPSQFCFWVSKNAKTETTAARKSSRRSMANCVCSLTTLTDAKIIWLRW